MKIFKSPPWFDISASLNTSCAHHKLGGLKGGHHGRALKKIKFYFLAVLLLAGCGKSLKTNLIDYSFTLYKEFKNTANVGRVIPLTISKSAEIDGSLAKDAKFLYFASNRDGNFDIYVRGMGDIKEKAITQNAAEDTSPQVSPDGKKLIFVSRRNDPRGDILFLDAQPEKWLTREGPAIEEYGGDNNIGDLVNLTERRNERNVRMSITDIDPVWSPDGKIIAFVSNRGKKKINNIWLMDAKGKNTRQLTTKGGIQPSFSADGSKIIYISYQDKSNDGRSLGEIYEIGANGGKPKRLTKNNEIEMYPIYLGSTFVIAYTRIYLDSNEDGIVDLKDNSTLVYWDKGKNIQYPLTVSQNNSFNIKYYPNLYKDQNVILFTGVKEGNLDVSIIPLTGIIPRRSNIRSQYLLANKFLSEHDDSERYVLGLRRIKDFHAGNRLAYIYMPRAFSDIANYYIERGSDEIAASYLNELRNFSVKKPKKKKGQVEKDFDSIYEIIAQAQLLNLDGEDGLGYLDSKINEFKAFYRHKLKTKEIKSKGKDKSKKKSARPAKEMNMLIFLYEMLGDMAVWEEEYSRALGAYENALVIHDRYPLYQSLLRKTGSLRFKVRRKFYDQDVFPPEWVKLFKMRRSPQDIRKADYIISQRYLKEKNPQRGLKKIARIEKKYKKYKNIPNIANYIKSIYKFRMNQWDEAIEGFHRLEKISRTNPIHFSALVYLGKCYEMTKNKKAMEKYYSLALTADKKGREMYLRAFRNPVYHEIKWKLVKHYDEEGRKTELENKFSKAAQIYEKWVHLMHWLNNTGISHRLYEEKGVEAHTRYVDATLKSLKNNKGKIEKFIESYNNKSAVDMARVTYNKAYLFGAAYLYHKYGLMIDTRYRMAKYKKEITLNPGGAIGGFLEYQKKAEDELKWVIYMDEEFLDAYLLQGFIYALVDIRRTEDKRGYEDLYKDYFQNYLLEETITIYNKALRINNENINPEMEGNFYLNLANSFYLLKNYPKALIHYKNTLKYKSSFDSPLQEAQFNFHLAYSYWQNGKYTEAGENFTRVRSIYQALNSAEGNRGKGLYDDQALRITLYLAMLKRENQEFRRSIDLFNQVLISAKGKKDFSFAIERIYQELAYCYFRLGETNRSTGYLAKASKILSTQKEEEEKTYKMRWKLLNLRNKLGYKFDFGLLSPFLIPNLIAFDFVDSKGFPWIDLGEDSSVIGANRIARALNQGERIGLNYSLYAQNYLSQGDYRKAISFLEKKWNYMKEPRTKFDWGTKAFTGNNLGYYYFKLGNFKKAKEYFENTSKILSGDDFKDFQMDLVNRMNNIYVTFFLLERRPDQVKDPLGLIDSTLQGINDYIEKYKKGILEESLEKEEERLKGLKKEMTERDKKRVKRQVEQKVKITLFKLRMIIADLYYYRVNVLERMALESPQRVLNSVIRSKPSSNKESKKEKKNDNPAEKVQKINRAFKSIYSAYKELDNTYAELLDLMAGKSGKNSQSVEKNQKEKKSALAVPVKEEKLPSSIRKNRRILSVLYGNRGRILDKMGKWGEALFYYFRTLRISREYGYEDVTMSISYYTAKILDRNRDLKKLMGDRFPAFDDEFFDNSKDPWFYYTQAMDTLLNDMVLANSMKPFIKEVFEASQKYLINGEQYEKALFLVEKESALLRVADLINLQPELPDKAQDKILFEYIKAWSNIRELKIEISAARENIASQGGRIPELKKRIFRNRKKIQFISRKILRDYPNLASFIIRDIDLESIRENLASGEVVIRYKVHPAYLYNWKISKENVEFIKTPWVGATRKKNENGVVPERDSNELLAFTKLLKRSENKLTIVPDNRLYRSSFDSLETGKKRKRKFFDKYQVKFLPELFYLNRFNKESSISRRTYMALGLKKNNVKIAGVTVLPEAASWKKIFKGEKIDILDVDGKIPIREGFKQGLNPAVLLVDMAKMNSIDLGNRINRWVSLALAWGSSAVYFYDSVDEKTKIKLVEMINKGNERNIRKAISNVNIKSGKKIIKQFWMGMADFRNYELRELGKIAKRIKRQIQEYIFERDYHKIIDLNKKFLHIYGGPNAPREVGLQSHFFKVVASLEARDLKNYRKEIKAIERRLQGIKRVNKNKVREIKLRLNLMKLHEIYFTKGLAKGDDELKKIIQEAKKKRNPDLKNSARAMQAFFRIKEGLVQKGQRAFEQIYPKITNREIQKKLLYQYARYLQMAYLPRASLKALNRGVKLVSVGDIYESYFQLSRAFSYTLMNDFRGAERALKVVSKKDIKSHSYYYTRYFLDVMKGDNLEDSFQKVDAYLSNLEKDESIYIQMDFILLKAILLEKLGRYREANVLLTEKLFKNKNYLNRWGAQKNVERFMILAKSYSKMELMNDFFKNSNRFIDYLKKHRLKKMVLEEYYYYVRNTFERGIYKKALSKSMEALSFAKKLKIKRKLTRNNYHDILFFGFDSGTILNKKAERKKIWKLILNDKTIPLWRKLKRIADNHLKDKKINQALRNYQRVVNSVKSLKRPLSDIRFTSEIEESYISIIKLLKQNKKGEESLNVLRQYYDWKYSNSRIRQDMLRKKSLKKEAKKGKESKGKQAA